MSVTKASTCERESELISFLYGEANDQEAAEFERHLKDCRYCQNETSSFGAVRESIGVWKESALTGFVSPQVAVPVRQKSALAAVRAFFDLSPLWMKGAVGFATVLFCLLAVLSLTRSRKQTIPQVASGSTYTQQQVDEQVAKALKNQADQLSASSSSVSNARQTQPSVTMDPMPQRPRVNKQTPKSGEWAKVRRPLSKSERQQLAADLRLLSSKDEDTLNLLGDRINQEF